MADTFIVVSSPGPQGPAGSGAVALGYYDVTDYGAVDGADSTTSIQAAIDAIPIGGGVLYFPPGVWKCTAGLDLAERRNIILKGNGGTSGGAQTASLLYTTQTGTGSFLDCRGSAGVQFRDLEIGYSSGSFTGRVIDYRLQVGTAAYGGLYNCLVTGLGVATARLVDTDQAIFLNFENSVFGGADIAVYGKATNGSFSNGINFRGCTFNNCTTVAMRNPGQWNIDGCGYEGSGADTANAIDHDSGNLCRGVTIQGCWTGDTTGGTTFKLAGKGISVIGNYIGATGGIGVDLDEVSNGVMIEGNEFQCTTAVDFSSLAHTAVSYRSNGFTSVTNESTSAGSIVSGVTQLSAATTFYGTTTLTDANNLTLGTSTGTKIGTGATQKLGFWNATPVVQVTGWGTPTGTATRTTYASSTVSTEELAERLLALITDLKSYGILGA